VRTLAAQAALQEAVVEDERFHPLASNRRGVEEDGKGMTHVEHAVILTAFNVAAQVHLSAPRCSGFRVGLTRTVLGSMKGLSDWAQEATGGDESRTQERTDAQGNETATYTWTMDAEPYGATYGGWLQAPSPPPLMHASSG
jgi:hypothetical protein